MGVTKDRIRAMPRFADAAEETLQAAAGLFNLRRFEPGEVLIRQGLAADRFLIIESGHVKWERRANPDAPSLLDIYGPCETPGELALRLGVPNPASAVALTEGVAMFMFRDHYNTLLMGDDGIFRRTERCITDRAYSLWGRIEAAGIASVESRISAFLYRLVLKFGVCGPDGSITVPFVLSRGELASAVNCRRETAGRVMTAWEKKGWAKDLGDRLILAAPVLKDFEGSFGVREQYFGSGCARCRDCGIV